VHIAIRSDYDECPPGGAPEADVNAIIDLAVMMVSNQKKKKKSS
jgi:hypothetical protein